MTKPNLSKIVDDIKLSLTKHSPEILMGLGITGMITTTVLAVKATPRALMLIEEKKKEERKDKLTPVETFKVAWKCYVPATLTGVTSIACLIGSGSVHARRNAALATAYKISETALVEYKEKVIETIGEKKEKTIQDKIDKDKIDNNPVSQNSVIVTGKGTTLCYDALFGRYFDSDIEQIKRAINEINRRIMVDMYVSLNEFYDELGIPHAEVGDDLGWNIDDIQGRNLLDVSFGSQITDDDRPCIVMRYTVAPKRGYSSFV